MYDKAPEVKWYWRVIVAFTISSIFAVVIWVFSKFKEPPGFSLLLNTLQLLMAYMCLESVSYFQKRYYNSSLFKIKSINKWFAFLGSVLIGLLLYDFLFFCFKWLDHYMYNSEPPLPQHMVAATLIGLLMSLIFGLISFIIHWKNEYYRSRIQNEQFKKEIIISNLNILRHQLDPHFMFNNFNTLYYLIDEDTKLAKSFLKNISNIYRYILQNSEKSLIPAIEEYKISKQYLDVIKQRYGNNLQISDHIKLEALNDKNIPPLVLQQLIENVIKHNRIDENALLSLSIYVDNSKLTIKNNHNPKRSENQVGFGLENIKKRYEFLSEKHVEVTQNANEFSVSIPLIPSKYV